MFWGFAYYAAKSSEARHAAESHELAVREVHHRLKNSLQLISSLIRMRSAKFTDPQLREIVNEITNDLKAVAEVHSLVQGASKPGTVDIAQTIKTLCEYLHTTYRADMTCKSHVFGHHQCQSCDSPVGHRQRTGDQRHQARRRTRRGELLEHRRHPSSRGQQRRCTTARRLRCGDG